MHGRAVHSTPVGRQRCGLTAARSGFVAPGMSFSRRSSGASSGAAAAALFRFLERERESFATGQPELPPALAAGLREHLDQLSADDLRVGPRDAAGIYSRSGIAFQDVYSCPEMTLAIFLLRAGARIPLHDHPGMHVYGRLLFGSMRVLSFDFEPSSDDGSEGTRWATLRSDEVIGPSPTTYSLGPSTGNLHELEAVEDCAFFDVLAPPYDPYNGRDCTYYRRDEAAGDGGRYALAPVDLWGFSMQTLVYRGPGYRGSV